MNIVKTKIISYVHVTPVTVIIENTTLEVVDEYVYLEQVVRIACGYKEIEVSCPKNCTYDSCPKSADEKNECKSNTKSGEDNDESCVPGCKCAFNYRRAENGTCIPTRAYPPFDCPGENEHYDPCPPYCTDNCGALKADGTCNIVGRIGVILQCFPKCRCNKGYGRLNGICVPNSDCKKN